MRLYHEKHGYKFTDGNDLEKLLKDGYVKAPYGVEVGEVIAETSIEETANIETALTPVSAKFSDDKRVKKAQQVVDKVVKAVKA